MIWKIIFHVWSLIILLTNTARVKVLSSIMKMQILDQKCRMPDHELSRFISGFFCTFVTHPSKSVLSVFSSLDLNIITDITKLLFLTFKNTKYLIYEQDSGYKIFMSKFFFLWVNRALKLDESINNLTIGKFSF